MKYLFLALALTGCITDPKTTTRDYEVPESCMDQPDSTTYIDLAPAVEHYSCTVNPTN